MTTPSTALRYALIGAGAGIAYTHLAALAQLPEATIVGMADVQREPTESRAAALGCPYSSDHRAMLDAVRPDIVVITAPHPFHADLAVDAFAAGAHVLTEKPIAVEVAEADRMIDAADRAGRLLAVSFQQRFKPSVEYARSLIDTGVIGPLVRVLCVEPWYRTHAYFRAAGWRGTWQGEGGGVLLNQAPHPLDLLGWLAGPPARVWGWTRTLRHSIETEDSAQAMLEYPNGAPGYFTASTIETGSARRLHIVGENGALEMVGDRVTVQRFTPSLSEYSATTQELYRGPDTASETHDLPGDGDGHLAVYRDLHAAIAEGRAPRCDGRGARLSLELANAITMSSFQGGPVDLPIDRAAYHSLLRELRAGMLSMPRGPQAAHAP